MEFVDANIKPCHLGCDSHHDRWVRMLVGPKVSDKLPHSHCIGLDINLCTEGIEMLVEPDLTYKSEPLVFRCAPTLKIWNTTAQNTKAIQHHFLAPKRLLCRWHSFGSFVFCRIFHQIVASDSYCSKNTPTEWRTFGKTFKLNVPALFGCQK